MRLLFFGYHNVGYFCLQVLIELCREWGDEIAAVVTHADNPHENLWFASVRDLAFQHYLPVYQPEDVNDPAFVAVMAKLKPDLLFSCYYRHMLKPPLLALPSRGALNLHGSLLPKYRGRVPVNWVLVHGETETGVTLHYMVAKADQGDMVAQRRVPIAPEDTAETLFAKMTVAAAELLRETYPRLRAGTAPRIPQDHSQATYDPPCDEKVAAIDWSKPGRAVFNFIRGCDPQPGATALFRGEKVKFYNPRFVELEHEAPPGEILEVNPDLGLTVAVAGGAVRITPFRTKALGKVKAPEFIEALKPKAGERFE